MVYDCGHFTWMSLTQTAVRLVLKDARGNCQPHWLGRLSKDGGKQVLFGSFPLLISSIHSNAMEDFLQKSRAVGVRARS